MVFATKVRSICDCLIFLFCSFSIHSVHRQRVRMIYTQKFIRKRTNFKKWKTYSSYAPMWVWVWCGFFCVSNSNARWQTRARTCRSLCRNSIPKKNLYLPDIIYGEHDVRALPRQHSDFRCRSFLFLFFAGDFFYFLFLFYCLRTDCPVKSNIILLFPFV